MYSFINTRDGKVIFENLSEEAFAILKQYDTPTAVSTEEDLLCAIGEIFDEHDEPEAVEAIMVLINAKTYVVDDLDNFIDEVCIDTHIELRHGTRGFYIAGQESVMCFIDQYQPSFAI